MLKCQKTQRRLPPKCIFGIQPHSNKRRSSLNSRCEASPFLDCQFRLQTYEFSWKATPALEQLSQWSEILLQIDYLQKCSDLPQAALKTHSRRVQLESEQKTEILCLFCSSLHVFLTRFRISAYAGVEIDTNFELIILSAFRVHTMFAEKLRH